MYNDLFKIGPITIYGYGLMIAAGVLCALLAAAIRADKRGLDNDIIYGLGIVALVFGFIGAKILYCIVEIKSFFDDPLQTLSGSGFVVYGGIIGGVLAAIIYCKSKKVSFLEYLDFLIPSVAIAQGFGRIGCFLAGCCYGRKTDSAIGVIFYNSSIAPNGVRLIPTQLFSSMCDFLIAAVLLIYAKKPRDTGKVGALYFILYSIGRFLIEFFRADDRGSVGILSTSQLLSLFTLVIGVAMFFINKRSRIRKENAC